MAELIPLPEEGITLSSSSSVQSSSDSSYNSKSQSKSGSKSVSREPSSDSVHTSDQLAESDPEGIPLDQLDANPHFVAFEAQGDLVAFEVGKAMLNAFVRHTSAGFVGTQLGSEGYGAPVLCDPPEGCYASADEALKNSALVEDLTEDVKEMIQEYCFVNASYAEAPKKKNDPKSIKRLWNSEAAKAKRKELKAIQDKIAREQKLSKKRKAEHEMP